MPGETVTGRCARSPVLRGPVTALSPHPGREKPPLSLDLPAAPGGHVSGSLCLVFFFSFSSFLLFFFMLSK